ncbi:MAG: efflux transporter outer membrane subunit [Opitutaceae bacterium]|nr:efflux transporter outer membrane subunit [Opitutaceae bacterium]
MLLSALVFAGCKTKTPPTRAEIQQQALPQFVLTDPWKAGGAEGVIQDNWLATFNDEQLNALVREALTNNLDLRISATRIEQAEQYLQLSKSGMRPRVGVAGTGGISGGGGSDVGSALQGIMLAVSWEPDLWGRIRYGRNAAQAGEASAQADFQFARQSLAATTAKSWFTASETWLQLQLVGDMVKSSQDLVTLADQRRKIGAGTEQEIVQARASLGSFQDSAKQLRLAHQQALRALELLLGRYPSAELAARESLPALPGPVPVGMPLASLERRPDLIAAEQRVAVAFNRVGEARAARLPRITLNGSVAAINSEVLDLKPGFQNPVGGLGADLVAPIYTGGALKAQVEIRTLEQKEAVAQYASMALRAIGDVESALAIGENLAEREQLLDQNIADNQRALELAQTVYRIGKGDLRNVQQQQLSVYAAQITRLRVKSEQLSQRINLHLALGGSFETPPGPDTETKVAENSR